MLRYATLAILSALFICASAYGQDGRAVDQYEIEANIDEVWKAFTTTEGLKSWVAPLADVDFRVGGKWRANYNEKGKLGDETTIENTILCYDPKRMLSLKATSFPKGFMFADAAKDTWSIFYFKKISNTKTAITLVGLGYTDSEQSKKLRSFFKAGNKYSMDKLRAALEKNKQPR